MRGIRNIITVGAIGVIAALAGAGSATAATPQPDGFHACSGTYTAGGTSVGVVLRASSLEEADSNCSTDFTVVRALLNKQLANPNCEYAIAGDKSCTVDGWKCFTASSNSSGLKITCAKYVGESYPIFSFRQSEKSTAR